MPMKKTATAAVITASLMALSASFSVSAQTATVCSEVATEAQASELMKRLFPDSKILSAEPLKVSVSTSCLLEVEMLTIANDPKSKGIVYVLPDGDHFLNGPLMSKRSWVGVTPAPQTAENQIAKNSMTDQLSDAQPGEIALPLQAQSEQAPSTSAELRKQTLERLHKNPFVTFNFNDQPEGTANVLFDVDCPYCIKQYQEMEAAAKEHNINFNWIPVYLNQRSWGAAALLMRETQKDPKAGRDLLDQFMKKSISNEKLSDLYKTLNESDFAKAKETNVIFAEVVRQARVGTPLTFVENKNGNVKVSSGKLDLEEWKVMLED